MTERVIRTRIRTYFATEADATSENRVLKEGEIYTEKNASTGLSTGRRKVGTGTAAWVDLPYEPSSGGGGGGSTDLSIANRGATTLDVASSTGNDATLPAATNALAGVATAAQIAKLEGIAAGATANATDAQLRDRSTHTGTQAWGTITGPPTTLSGYGITDAQPYDADLAAIAALAGTSGLLRKTAADTWSLDTSAYLTGNQAITVTGDASGSGATSITLTLASVVTAGTYRSVTVDAKGRVTAGTTPTTFAGYGISDSSVNLAAAISDETGTGSLVFANSPTLVTPALGTPSSITLTNATGLPAGGVSFTATQRLLARNSAGAGVGEEASISTVLDWLSSTRGTILYRGVSGWVALEPGTSGQVLQTNGAGADPGWATASGGGLSSIYYSAADFIPATTNGCGVDSQETATNRVNRDFLAFDPAAIERAIVWFPWPSGWSTAKVTVFWTATSGTGSAVFGAEMRVYNDADSTDLTWGTAQTVTDAAASANTHRQTAATGGITPAGTLTAGAQAALRIYRDATNVADDLAVDALVSGVLIERNS